MATKLSNTAGGGAMPQAASVGTAIDGTEVHLDDVNTPALQLPTIHPNTPFLIAVHPNHWHINNGFLVPSFKMIPVKAGVEGAKVSGNGVDMSKPKQVAAAKGFTIIPTSAGPGGRSYLTLGTDGFGRSDTRAALRGYFGVDAASIVKAALGRLNAFAGNH